MAKIAALPELDTERNIKYEENIKYMRHRSFNALKKFDLRYSMNVIAIHLLNIAYDVGYPSRNSPKF